MVGWAANLDLVGRLLLEESVAGDACSRFGGQAQRFVMGARDQGEGQARLLGELRS